MARPVRIEERDQAQPKGQDTKPAPCSVAVVNGQAINDNAAPRSPTPRAGKRTARRGGATPVPDQLTVADRKYAVDHGMSDEAAITLARRFIDYYRAEGKQLYDWSAKRRNWVDKTPKGRRLDSAIL